MRAAVEWSYTLLDPVEQAAFRSLAVFVGGFDADAACAVAPGMSLDVLARLVDKSLITVVPGGRHRTRYRLLDTMRAYALEQLASANEAAAARARHLRYFSTIGIPVEYGFMSARVVSLLEQWAADYGNVRAALEWAAASSRAWRCGCSPRRGISSSFWVKQTGAGWPKRCCSGAPSATSIERGSWSRLGISPSSSAMFPMRPV